jgi:cysteinyl-tRNA synthetase
MIRAHLGETIDIHGGGLDLIFPHHENEIAQSRCAFGHAIMAKYWMHNGFLQVEGRKMSKSEGNFVTIHDLLETEKFGGRKWPGEVLRLAMLMTHYREPIDFSIRRLVNAESLFRPIWGAIQGLPAAAFTGPPHASIVEPLRDDLNTPAAIQNLKHLYYQAVNRFEAVEDVAASAAFLGLLPLIAASVDVVEQADTVSANATIGDRLLTAAGVDRNHLEARIQERLAALAAKDFAKADAIRAELLEKGIQLMDYKDPATGERRTKWEVKR